MLDSYKFSHRISFNVKWIKRTDKLTNKLLGCFLTTFKLKFIYTRRKWSVIWSTWFLFSFFHSSRPPLCYSRFIFGFCFFAKRTHNILLWYLIVLMQRAFIISILQFFSSLNLRSRWRLLRSFISWSIGLVFMWVCVWAMCISAAWDTYVLYV